MDDLRNALLALIVGGIAQTILGRGGVLGLGPKASKCLVWACIAATWVGLTLLKHKPGKEWLLAHPLQSLGLYVGTAALLGFLIWFSVFIGARHDADAKTAVTTPPPVVSTDSIRAAVRDTMREQRDTDRLTHQVALRMAKARHPVPTAAQQPPPAPEPFKTYRPPIRAGC